MNRTLGEREALDQCLPMARALFGEKVESAVLALNQQFWIVKVDVDCYIDDNGADQKFSQKLRRGMYEADPPEGEVNEVTEAAKEAVQTIEDACLPVLRS